MYRIELSCDHEAPRFPAAPQLAGEIVIGDFSATMHFLVDTGADSSLLNGRTMQVPERVMLQGGKDWARGVGGLWPARLFNEGLALAVAAIEEETGDTVALEIPMPASRITSPYAKRHKIGKRKGQMEEHLMRLTRAVAQRYAKKYEFIEYADVPSLLGRNIFVDHHLKMEYDPHGESAIIIPAKSGLAAAVQTKGEAGPPKASPADT